MKVGDYLIRNHMNIRVLIYDFIPKGVKFRIIRINEDNIIFVCNDLPCIFSRHKHNNLYWKQYFKLIKEEDAIRESKSKEVKIVITSSDINTNYNIHHEGDLNLFSLIGMLEKIKLDALNTIQKESLKAISDNYSSKNH